jgi:(2Fe-2S) ferredoxin
MPTEKGPAIKDGLVLRVCRGHTCGSASDEIEKRLREVIDEQNLNEQVGLASEACFGRCFFGPNILVERWRDGHRNERAMMQLMMMQKHPDLRWEHNVRPEDVPKLLRWHLNSWRKSQEEGDEE